MDIQTLTRFFMWCTILNGGILLLWSATILLAPDFLYNTHSRWFSISRESFNVVIYSFLALTKIFFVFFSAVPYVALLMVG